MKTKIVIGVFIALLVLLFVSLFFNYKQYRDAKDKPPVTAVTVETHTESHEATTNDPQPVSENQVGTISVTVAKPVQKGRIKFEPIIDEDTTEAYRPPDAESDSMTIELPKTQKVYTDDSTYTAYVSGYQHNLDSIKVRSRVVTNTITRTVTVEKPKYRKFNIGVVGGYGYGFKSKQVEPFIGIGVTWSLF